MSTGTPSFESLLSEVARLRAALVPLVANEPIVGLSGEYARCAYCRRVGTGRVVHAPDCDWLLARERQMWEADK